MKTLIQLEFGCDVQFLLTKFGFHGSLQLKLNYVWIKQWQKIVLCFNIFFQIKVIVRKIIRNLDNDYNYVQHFLSTPNLQPPTLILNPNPPTPTPKPQTPNTQPPKTPNPNLNLQPNPQPQPQPQPPTPASSWEYKTADTMRLFI